MDKFRCSQCDQLRRESQRKFFNSDWCDICVTLESRRSMKEDLISPGDSKTLPLHSRPPKYMLQPENYSKFGY